MNKSGSGSADLSIKVVRSQVEDLSSKLSHLQEQIRTLSVVKSECQRDLYEAQIRKHHIEEIYRCADEQFPRLRRESGNLSSEDILELEKWIGRAKSNDGLKDIVNALHEIKKYQPSDIRRSLYAMVQRIIIEGPYEKDKKK